MSRWAHAICEPCWNDAEPGRPVSDGWPPRIREEHRRTESCCYCGLVTSSGIYRRDNPDALRCEGHHSGTGGEGGERE